LGYACAIGFEVEAAGALFIVYCTCFFFIASCLAAASLADSINAALVSKKNRVSSSEIAALGVA
jgi:hypothetical protein